MRILYRIALKVKAHSRQWDSLQLWNIPQFVVHYDCHKSTVGVRFARSKSKSSLVAKATVQRSRQHINRPQHRRFYTVLFGKLD